MKVFRGNRDASIKTLDTVKIPTDWKNDPIIAEMIKRETEAKQAADEDLAQLFNDVEKYEAAMINEPLDYSPKQWDKMLFTLDPDDNTLDLYIVMVAYHNAGGSYWKYIKWLTEKKNINELPIIGNSRRWIIEDRLRAWLNYPDEGIITKATLLYLSRERGFNEMPENQFVFSEIGRIFKIIDGILKSVSRKGKE